MIPEIHLGDAHLESFRLMVGLGVLLMSLSLIALTNKTKLSSSEENALFMTYAMAIVVAFFGSILLDSLFKIPIKGRFEIQGMTFYGGLLGAIGAVYVARRFVFKRALAKPLIYYYNLLTVPLLMFHICGRIGCFLAGCCYGRPTSSFLGVHYPANSLVENTYGDVAVFPVPLFEALSLTLILGIVLFGKKEWRFYCYLILYSVARFFLEFLRGDQRGQVLWGLISPAQLISLGILVFLGVRLLIVNLRKKKMPRSC